VAHYPLGRRIVTPPIPSDRSFDYEKRRAIEAKTSDASRLVAMKRPKKGRPRIEDRARTIEARKPWLKLEMSRRTWYRRQAEKRKGRE
jgi:hypothetical protein